MRVHVDPTAAQTRSSKQTKVGRPGDIVQKSANVATQFSPFGGLDDGLDYQSACVSVTPCLGEIPLANTPTQTAHTLGLTATGVSEATSLGEKQWRLGGSWLCLPYAAATVTEPHVGCCNF